MPAMTDTFENIEFTYDSQKRKHPAIEELQDIIQYKDMIFQFVRRDIVARYKRSVLGVFWTMLQPLGMMVIMSYCILTIISSGRRLCSLFTKRSDCMDILWSDNNCQPCKH